MNIAQRNSCNPAASFFQDVDRILTQTLRTPAATDHKFRSAECDEAWTLRFALPGFRKDQLSVTVKENVLSVEAKAAEDDEFQEDYTRRFKIPATANAEKLNGKYEDGVLTLTLPKAEVVEPETREIELA